MEPQRATLKNGLEIVLKPARIHEFVPGDPMPEGVSISVHCGWNFEKGASDFARGAPLFAAWHRAQARALGMDYSMILAWEGQDVVGFLSFCVAGDRPRESALQVPGDFCPYGTQSPDAARQIDGMPIEKMDFDTITITCAMSVAPKLKRHGVATAMLKYLIDLAKEAGWKRIKMAARLPEKQDGFWPATGLLEGVGFHCVSECIELDEDGTPGYEMHLDL